MKKFYQQYKHIIPLLVYGTIYLTWFALLEKANSREYTEIYMNIDGKIPFYEVFVIPYLLWFLYLAVVIVYMFFKNKEDYFKVCIFLATGMTIFLLISTFFPNCHHLRPRVIVKDNIFAELVSMLYRVDTSTNLWPSIHVYNSIGAYLAVAHNKKLSANKFIHASALALSVSIILSTMFIKQHSMFDVLTAFALSIVVYIPVYRKDLILKFKTNWEQRFPKKVFRSLKKS